MPKRIKKKLKEVEEGVQRQLVEWIEIKNKQSGGGDNGKEKSNL